MFAYLDNSATTRPTERVIERMSAALREEYHNPSALYRPAIAVEKQMNRCRRAIMEELHATSGQVIFTSGGTEANNLAILGAADTFYGPVHLALSAHEHPSVSEAFYELKRKGHSLSVIPIDGAGQLQWDALEKILHEKPRIVSCMHVNSETGAVLDLERLVHMTRAISPDSLIHVDGVQGFMRLPIQARGIDLYTLSAHKICGPKGIGALYARSGLRINPRMLGGGQEGNLRSGTENTVGIAGLFEAIAELWENRDIVLHMVELKRYLWEGIQRTIPEALLNGPTLEDGAPHIANISFEGVRAEVLLHALEADGVYVSTGSACSSKKHQLSPVLQAMGLNDRRIESALRISFAPNTQLVEVEYAIQRLEAAYHKLSPYKRR